MAKVELKYKPMLTTESLMNIFQKHFNNVYEIYESKLIGIDFVIKKSDFTGISIKLKQKDGRTIVQYGPLAPAFWVRFTFYGIIPLLILYLGPWKKMQNEIKGFLETTPELK
ncbi:MAG: hypothetical protein QG635_2264 [Bacteroidota bacterium]|nr:hypothetical protein [Bacteroidota bacterium]